MVDVLDARRRRSDTLREELARPAGGRAQPANPQSPWQEDLMHPDDLFGWHSNAYHHEYRPLIEVSSRGDCGEIAPSWVPFWALLKPFQQHDHQLYPATAFGGKYSFHCTDALFESAAVTANFSWDSAMRWTAAAKEIRAESDLTRQRLGEVQGQLRAQASNIADLQRELREQGETIRQLFETLQQQISQVRAISDEREEAYNSRMQAGTSEIVRGALLAAEAARTHAHPEVDADERATVRPPEP